MRISRWKGGRTGQKKTVGVVVVDWRKETTGVVWYVI